jgi:long-chain fatty acid transport protein
MLHGPGWTRLVATIGLLALFLPPAASSQVLTNIEFSFSNPGARSLGFGGAFVALADDATAAFANPAGLVQLSRPEVSLEGRFWSYSSPYTAGGRAAGTPTGIGIDTVAQPIRAYSEADLSGLSFVSVVYPRGRWSFAVYRHQLQNFELAEEIQGIFTPGPIAGAWRGPIERGLFDLQVTNLALAVAYRASDRLSLGLAVTRSDPSSCLVGMEYLPDDDSLEGYFAPASFLPERLVHVIRAESDGSDRGLALGLLYNLAPHWKLGGAFREGPELAFSIRGVAGPANPEFSDGQTFALGSTPWVLPDVFALGVAYRSADGRWTGSFEWTRVEYSTVLESLDPALQTPGEILKDADELHLGGEYAFFRGRSVMAVRLGAWHDPDHQPRLDSSPFARAEVPGGSDELHLAAGVGVVRDRIQLDLGIDVSERRDTASVSLIYSF